MRVQWCWSPKRRVCLDLRSRRKLSIWKSASSKAEDLIGMMLDPWDEVDFVMRIVCVHLIEHIGQLEDHLMVAVIDCLSIFVCNRVRKAHRTHLRPFLRSTNVLGSEPSSDPVACLDNLPVVHTYAVKHQCRSETRDSGADYRDGRILLG